jgi:hypothetical protein
MVRYTLLVILTYSLWLASAALSLWAIMWLRIVALIDLSIFMFRKNPWTLRVVDRFGTVILGLVWLIFVVATESYFRRLLERRLSVRPVAKIFAAEALILTIAYGGHLLLNW